MRRWWRARGNFWICLHLQKRAEPQPLLGTHMTLTFLSYGLEKVAAGDGEDEYTKYNR